MNNRLSKQDQDFIAELIRAPGAPEGPVATSFETALYVTAAMTGLDFEVPENLTFVNQCMRFYGYSGDGSGHTLKECREMLAALERQGCLRRLPGGGRYAVPGDAGRFTARVRTRRAEMQPGAADEDPAYVFYACDSEGREFELDVRYMVLPGEQVEISLVRRSGGLRAEVTALLTRRQAVLGYVIPAASDRGQALLEPEEPCLKGLRFVFSADGGLGSAKAGDVVVAEIVSRNARNFTVRTRERVGDIGSLSGIIVRAVLANDIPSVWPPEVLSEAANVPQEVQPQDLADRNDARDLDLVTIDGEDARDFDDAVFCRREDDGWRLWVAIADVSRYVTPGSALDREAMHRANSCYFPNYVIPMLPEALSNGICSLNPGVDRLCLLCELKVGSDGSVSGAQFSAAVMRSRARLTYTEAFAMMNGKKSRFPEHQHLSGLLQEMGRLYQALAAARERRHALSIEHPEPHFVFDEHLHITDVFPEERNDAHKFIEECMIAANVAAAELVSSYRVPALYRVHPRPEARKLGVLLTQIARFGLSLRGGSEPGNADYCELLKQAVAGENAGVIGEFVLRSMSKALYSPTLSGHFGLALEHYSHFTSPIRRYADLLLHRAIKTVLTDLRRPAGQGAARYTPADLVNAAGVCNERELSATVAERDVNTELCCEFLSHAVGQQCQGRVVGVTSYGLFVRLEQYMVDGMIYIGDFPDYMSFDAQRQTLAGSGKVYAAGDLINVQIMQVDPRERKISLLPPGAFAPLSAPQSVSRRRKSSGGPTVGVGELLKSITDIASTSPAGSGDLVARENTDGDLGPDISGAGHYSRPLGMPQSAHAPRQERAGQRRHGRR